MRLPHLLLMIGLGCGGLLPATLAAASAVFPLAPGILPLSAAEETKLTVISFFDGEAFSSVDHHILRTTSGDFDLNRLWQWEAAGDADSALPVTFRHREHRRVYLGIITFGVRRPFSDLGSAWERYLGRTRDRLPEGVSLADIPPPDPDNEPLRALRLPHRQVRLIYEAGEATRAEDYLFCVHGRQMFVIALQGSPDRLDALWKPLKQAFLELQPYVAPPELRRSGEAP